MIQAISNQLRKKGIKPDKIFMPKHIAMTVGGLNRHSHLKQEAISEVQKKAFDKVFEIIKYQLAFDIPIITLYLIDSKVHTKENYSEIIDSLTEFLRNLLSNNTVFSKKVKISVLGKWYDLPSRVVELIKRITDETKDYDHFFLNLCINYDGRDEIIDACKLLLRKALVNKIDVDQLNTEMIKENIYSSYFLPPDLIIKTGTGKRLHGFLLWDSPMSLVYFSNTLWTEFREKNIINAIKYYQNNRQRQ